MKLLRLPLLAVSFAALLPLSAEEKSTATPAASTTPAAKPDSWKPLRPFLGIWEGDVSGQSGIGRATRTYTFTLNNRFIEVFNKSVYPVQEKNPKGEPHEDRGFFSYDRAQKKLLLRQFHVEGFVNLFALDRVSDDGRTLVFVTTAIENIPPGWRARETYTFTGDHEFTEKFELAEPGKDFALYSETRFRRKGP